jgi:hypothetical protein
MVQFLFGNYGVCRGMDNFFMKSYYTEILEAEKFTQSMGWKLPFERAPQVMPKPRITDDLRQEIENICCGYYTGVNAIGVQLKAIQHQLVRGIAFGLTCINIHK